MTSAQVQARRRNAAYARRVKWINAATNHALRTERQQLTERLHRVRAAIALFESPDSPGEDHAELPLGDLPATTVSVPLLSDSERLRALRLKQGWTWGELARRLQMSRGALWVARHKDRPFSERLRFRLTQLEKAAASGSALESCGTPPS